MSVTHACHAGRLGSAPSVASILTPSCRDAISAPSVPATLPTPEETDGLFSYGHVMSEDSSTHTGSNTAMSSDGSENAVTEAHVDRRGGNSSQMPAATLPVALSSPAAQPHAPIDRFEAFVKDNLGLYAPSFNANTSRTPYPRAVPGQSGSQLLGGLNDLADASPIPRLDVDMTTRPTLDLEQQIASLDSADMEYLRAKGAFDLPPRELQQELIEAHFAEVHPTTPVLNRHKFLSDFHNHQIPSRLLLFAVFTSGCRACRNPELLDQKGTNHTTAQRFYKATKVSQLSVDHNRIYSPPPPPPASPHIPLLSLVVRCWG